jgi:penicillin-binding protein 2
VSLRRALTQSCDTYFYWLADKMGLDPIAAMGEKLGFGHLSGIELPSETAGVMPTEAFHERVDHGYTKGYALNAAIGQGAVNVTPLQLAMAYATLANGGTLYKPHLVMEIDDADGTRTLRQVEPETVRKIEIKPAHLSAIMDGLIGVVNTPGGTAYGKRLADIKMAGKTGTAQNVVIGEKRIKATDMEWAQRDHAWFASIAPADDPEIAVVVINEHGGHGGAAAAPVAMAVIQAYFDYKNKPPLSEQEILELKPHPHYAGEVVAERDVPEHRPFDEPGRVTSLPIDARTGPGDAEESTPSDEVADPVRAPKRRRPLEDRAGSTGERPGGD